VYLLDDKTKVVKVCNIQETENYNASINEADILKTLKHDNIVELYDYFINPLLNKSFLV